MKTKILLSAIVALGLVNCKQAQRKAAVVETFPGKITEVQTIEPTDGYNSAGENLGTGSLPEWIFDGEVIVGKTILNKYEIDLRMEPVYLEEDFNGDGIIDIILPIREPDSHKVGFAIIHGQTNDVAIIGAGKTIKNGLGDDMFYIDIWGINREKENTGTDIDENGDLIETPVLILNNPSIKIEKTEVGGGIIFWNGEEYEYLHQTC